MSKEKAKHIPVEDGNAETEKVKEEAEAEEAKEAEEAAEAGETAEAETEGNAEESEKSEEGPSAEEQESERYMRLMAEFQNFKRRAAKEKSDIHAFANERIVGDLLPVLDNFERALSTETEDTEYAKGHRGIRQGHGADIRAAEDGS